MGRSDRKFLNSWTGPFPSVAQTGVRVNKPVAIYKMSSSVEISWKQVKSVQSLAYLLYLNRNAFRRHYTLNDQKVIYAT